jgi:3-methyl-2-oxobutanoate hydroxymethyltransferase
MKRISAVTLYDRKQAGEKIAVLTAYDYPSAKLMDEAGVDAILVGDSLGMVVQGHDDTLSVTMDQMVYHTSCVTRGAQRALVIADLPFMSYQINRDESVRNAGRLISEGGAQAVKLEGPADRFGDTIRGILDAGIPVMGHIGLTPQSVHALGGYKVQGRDPAARQRLIEEAMGLEETGCFGIVLECMPASLAAEITKRLSIPTIGIGAGPDCDGQVLVMHDMLGLGMLTKFTKSYGDVGKVMSGAFENYVTEVKAGSFPTVEQAYS